MSIFGKDHYIKFCITTFSWIYENHDYNYMSCTCVSYNYVCCVYVAIRLNFLYNYYVAFLDFNNKHIFRELG